MAKGKNNGSVQNRAIFSRVSFLQQAATLLSASPAQQPTVSHSNTAATVPYAAESNLDAHPPLQGMSRRLATDLRSVSLKTRIRLSPAVKQAICKFCDSILIEGQSCTSSVENKSRGGKKPWADVMVRKCHTCGRERRYPVSAPRPRRKTER
ncbi:RNAse P Rpr2/Rpp21/SNM1 subunit domain-containing protein, partial [Cercophora newfieldiana]